MKVSEDHYRSLFENMLNGFAYCQMLFDQDKPIDFIYINVNTAFERLTGLKNVTGKKVSEVIPGIQETDPGLLEIYGRVASTGIVERFETYLEALGIWFSISVYSPAQGYFVSVFDNISERKHAEAALLASEAKYRTLVENIPHKILSKDRNSTFLSCNENYAQVLGISAEEFAGHTDYDFYPKELADQYRADDRKILETGITEVIEEKNLQRGQEIWVQTVKTPIRKADGEITGILVIFDDISERKRAQEELFRSKQMLQLVLDNIPQRVFWKNRTLTYLGSNKSHAADAGLVSTDDIIGKTDFDLIWRESAALYQADDRLVMENDQPKLNFEENSYKSDGSQTWLRTSKVPLHDPEGKVIGVLGTYENITDRKKAEEEVERITQDLRRSNKELERSAQELSLLDRVRTGLAREVDMSVILRTVVEAVANTFDYQLVSIYTLQGNSLILQHQVGYQDVLREIPLGTGVISRAVLSGQPVILEDVRSEPAFLITMDGIVSEIAMPLFLKGQVAGVLNIESIKGVKLGKRDLEILVALSKNISIAFERANLYDALSRSEERFRSSIETLLDGFAVFSSVRNENGVIIDFRYEYINEAGCLLNQRPLDDHLGRTMLDLLPGHREAGLIEEYTRTVETGKPMVKEDFVYEDAFGSGKRVSRAYDTRAVRLGDGFAVVWRDVTERRRNEALIVERNQELALLNHASQAFNSTLDLDQVLQAVLEMLSTRIASASSFWLVDPETGELICRQAHGPLSDVVVGKHLPPGKGLVGWVAQHGRRLAITDIQADIQQYNFTEGDPRFTRSVLIVPIRFKEKVIGVLQLLDARPGVFDEAASEIVESLAAIAAVAIENARLYAQVEQLAIQDELTGLYNRRGFYLLAEQQVKQAERANGKLALIYLDVDDFKQINDTWGHQVGDQALIAIAKLLKQTFRSSDVIARIGGDEFVILANISDTDKSLFPSQRLKTNIQNGDFHFGRDGKLSMSIGHAVWNPGSPQTLDQVLTRADAAMYREKVEKKKRSPSSL